MEISDYEYQNLKNTEARYNWLLNTALKYASLHDSLEGELYIRGTGLREELKLYRLHDYDKRVHELKAEAINNKGGFKRYGY